MPLHNVFLKVEDVPGEPSSGGTQWLKPDGSVRLVHPSTDSGYGNPSSLQIISQGDEGGSRLFVENLTMHSEATNTAVETDWLL